MPTPPFTYHRIATGRTSPSPSRSASSIISWSSWEVWKITRWSRLNWGWPSHLKQESLPVVQHEAVAEVSRMGTLRRSWLLWIMDDRAKTLTNCPIVDLTNWLFDLLTDWLTKYLTDELTNWLIDQLTNWLTDSLTTWPTSELTN